MSATSEKTCEQHLIPAYIDGELDKATQQFFDDHLHDCPACRSELRIHQQFICALDAALGSRVEVDVPANFSKLIAARATSDMSGVRSAAENRKALVFCLVLAISGFALVGVTARQLAVSLVWRVAGKAFGLIDVTWNAVYDLVASFAVICRVLSRKFIVETGSLGIALTLLALAVLLLSRLIFSYHRTGAIE
ncbi:MAG TPA: zf-HC2 domain-containing protein [Pyrinomonadaceae bacterium]|jgi:predicted anti-sigma-YlaC factor YlaD|nr:zf-HC2 domain-containing protein [Pyrinomonadaceae bacterium]